MENGDFYREMARENGVGFYYDDDWARKAVSLVEKEDWTALDLMLSKSNADVTRELSKKHSKAVSHDADYMLAYALIDPPTGAEVRDFEDWYPIVRSYLIEESQRAISAFTVILDVYIDNAFMSRMLSERTQDVPLVTVMQKSESIYQAVADVFHMLYHIETDPEEF